MDASRVMSTDNQVLSGVALPAEWPGKGPPRPEPKSGGRLQAQEGQHWRLPPKLEERLGHAGFEPIAQDGAGWGWLPVGQGVAEGSSGRASLCQGLWSQ